MSLSVLSIGGIHRSCSWRRGVWSPFIQRPKARSPWTETIDQNPGAGEHLSEQERAGFQLLEQEHDGPEDEKDDHDDQAERRDPLLDVNERLTNAISRGKPWRAYSFSLTPAPVKMLTELAVR
jgi:hypothetical protein